LHWNEAKQYNLREYKPWVNRRAFLFKKIQSLLRRLLRGLNIPGTGFKFLEKRKTTNSLQPIVYCMGKPSMICGSNSACRLAAESENLRAFPRVNSRTPLRVESRAGA